MSVKSKLSLNDLCIEAAIVMNNELGGDMYAARTPKHTQFVNWEDVDEGGVSARTGWYPGKVMKVIIEWVDESEADPKNFETV
jgi:hypothetical protein